MSAVLWLVWGLIGLVGGYMTARLMMDGERTVLMVLAGIAGAMLGGWLFMAFTNPASEGMLTLDRMQTLSLLTSAAGCALLVWLAMCLFGRHHTDEED